jgi:hypothetical protein
MIGDPSATSQRIAERFYRSAEDRMAQVRSEFRQRLENE